MSKPPALSNNPLDLTRRPMKSEASRVASNKSMTSCQNSVTQRLKAVAKEVSNHDKTQRNKILDISFWMKPFIPKFDYESRVRREEVVSMLSLEAEDLPPKSIIGTKVRFNLDVLEIEEIKEGTDAPNQFHIIRPLSSKALIQYTI